jgi:endonuclease III
MKRTVQGRTRLASSRSTANPSVTLFALEDTSVTRESASPPSPLTDLDEEKNTSTSPRRTKRRRVKVEIDATNDDTTAETELIIETKVSKPARKAKSSISSPSKKETKVASGSQSPRKPKAIAQSLETPHPAPEHWREAYDAIKEMRSKIVAPVDTMGCDTAQDQETDPKVQFSLFFFFITQ